MTQEFCETMYKPEVEEVARRKHERQVVQEGTELWRRRKEEMQRQKHREQRELREILENYSPWGKPGGGAPCAATLRKKNVPLEPPEQPRCHRFGQGWTSNSMIDRLYKRNIDPVAVADVNKFYDDGVTPGTASETQPLHDSRNLYNEKIEVYQLTGGVELLPLLINKRYQSHPQTIRYITTDATHPDYTMTESFRAFGIGNREYVADLTEQIQRKRDRILEERRIEQENCRRHHDTWKRLWGKPGHGAPIDHARRNNLYNILHRSAIY